MNGIRWLIAISATAGLALTGWAEPRTPDVSAARIQQLVAKLGSEQYRERESATRELSQVGEPAIQWLNAATRSPDAETRRRATELVERIQERVAMTRLLQPTLVEVKFQDAPLSEAVAELARLGNSPITLAPSVKNRNRPVTFATQGKQAFWQALEQFCLKADLREWDGQAPLNVASSNEIELQANQIALPQGQILLRSRVGRVQPPSPQIVLMDGTERLVPTSHAGAARTRCLLPNPLTPAATANAGDIILPFQISTEPRMGWQGVQDIRIDRALDNRGEKLKASPAFLQNGSEDDNIVMVNGLVLPRSSSRGSPIGVRLRKPGHPHASLDELSGTIVGQARIMEKLLDIENPAKQVGTTFRGQRGLSLKLVDLQARDQTIEISYELSVPADNNLPGGVVLGGGVMQIQGNIVIQGGILQGGGFAQATTAAEHQGLSLETAEGRKFPIASTRSQNTRIGPQGFNTQAIVSFRRPEKSSEPARLVFQSARPTLIEIPFRFTEVPLP